MPLDLSIGGLDSRVVNRTELSMIHLQRSKSNVLNCFQAENSMVE